MLSLFREVVKILGGLNLARGESIFPEYARIKMQRSAFAGYGIPIFRRVCCECRYSRQLS